MEYAFRTSEVQIYSKDSRASGAALVFILQDMDNGAIQIMTLGGAAISNMFPELRKGCEKPKG